MTTTFSGLLKTATDGINNMYSQVSNGIYNKVANSSVFKDSNIDFKELGIAAKATTAALFTFHGLSFVLGGTLSTAGGILAGIVTFDYLTKNQLKVVDKVVDFAEKAKVFVQAKANQISSPNSKK